MGQAQKQDLPVSVADFHTEDCGFIPKEQPKPKED